MVWTLRACMLAQMPFLKFYHHLKSRGSSLTALKESILKSLEIEREVTGSKVLQILQCKPSGVIPPLSKAKGCPPHSSHRKGKELVLFPHSGTATALVS
ncbi:hypothetical protein TNCV_2889731 [Trichonephila clavipes]|nr:hypothetical protein TNCV_2889731 [Trichonephila clavipes]